MIVKFRIRRDTAANWTSVNPVLALGEPGLETDTRRVKYGDGATAWNSLNYSSATAVWGQITGTLSDQTDLQSALDAKQDTITAAALTKTDDTNVTLTLGGSPSTALLAATSLTLGWTGQLAVARGGTGASTSTGSGAVVLATSPTLATTANISSASSALLTMTADNAGTARTGRLQVFTSSGDFAVRALSARLLLDFTTDLLFRFGTTQVGSISTTGVLRMTGDTIGVATEKTPASASATGTKGDICWDANFVYVCTASNTWKRAALSTW